MKLVFFTRHQALGASSRYRSVQYFDLLRARGHEIDQHHFFSDAYLRSRYADARPVGAVLGSYVARMRAALTAAADADAVIVEKELFPHLPAFTERLLRRGNAALIYDYDDAIWHSYERLSVGPLGPVFADKIRRVVAGADHVIAGSHYLEDQLRAWGARAVSRIPTTVPARRYQGQGINAEKTADIVWIGSLSTGVHVRRLFPVLERLHRERSSKARLIGFPRGLIAGTVPDFLEIVPWSAETELAMMASGRIGIMPLPDERFERGKCGFKLVQYMGMGLPTVASPIGENRHIVRDGQTGFLADSVSQWHARLCALLDAPEVAHAMGRAGYDRYTAHYSTEHAAEQLEAVIAAAVQARQPGREQVIGT